MVSEADSRRLFTNGHHMPKNAKSCSAHNAKQGEVKLMLTCHAHLLPFGLHGLHEGSALSS